MEDTKSVCKFCNNTISDTSVDSKYSANDFSLQVRECQLQRPSNDETLSTTNSDSVQDSLLDQTGIIRWLLENASFIELYFWDYDDILKECDNCNDADELLNCLKDYGISIKTNNIYDEFEKHNALFAAAKSGPPEIITWLVEHGASTECYNDENSSPIIIAAECGNLKNVIRLRNLGADVNAWHCVGNILTLAATNNHFHVIKWIFENNIISDDISRATALHIAIKKKYYDLVQWLVENNVSVCQTAGCENISVHYAAKIGNIVLMKWLIQLGAPLFGKNQQRKTVVHYAAKHGHLEMLHWLHSQGGNIHERIMFGFTPLHLAAVKGHLNCVEFLTHHGCDVNCKDRDGKTVLHVAAESNNLEVVQFLVNHGANVHALDDSRNSVLHYGVQNFEMLQWLVKIGCDPLKKNIESKTILSLASENFRLDTVRWLLEMGMNVNDAFEVSSSWLPKSQKDNNWNLLHLCLGYVKEVNDTIAGSTILHMLAPYPQALTYLLQHNTYYPSVEAFRNLNINSLDNCMNTALLVALKSHASASAMLLLDRGADIHRVNEYGKSALHLAASCGSINLVNKLIDLGADLNLKDKDGQTPLICALTIRSIIIIHRLVDAGADVNSVDIENRSVLYYAATCYQWKIVKFLIEAGANDVKSVIHHAVYTEDIDLITWLFNHGATIEEGRGGAEEEEGGHSSILHNCVYLRDETKKLPIMKLLVEHGANINSLNHAGQNILFNSLKNLEIMDFLIHNGINVNLQNEYGQSALHIAIQQYCYNMNGKDVHLRFVSVKKLLAAGANINARDNRGKSPLYYAVQDENYIDIAKILVLFGADVNSKDNEGTSILHVTRSGEIGVFLCENGANINDKDISGVTVLQNAIKEMPEDSSKNVNIVKVIQNKSINNIDSLSQSKDILNSISVSRYLKYIQFLIDTVNSIHEVDNKGRTALDYATEKGDLRIFEALINKGANAYMLTKKGDSILHSAARRNRYVLVQYIIDNLKCESLIASNNLGETPLHIAVQNQGIETVKLLVQHIDVNIKNNEMLSVLHIACRQGNLDIVKILLSNNANIHDIGDLSYTPIQIATKHCRLDIVKYLVEYSNDTNILQSRTDTNETLLHTAVKFGRFNNVPNDTVKYLIEKNVCPIDSVDDRCNTALHYACGTFMVDVVTILVEHGADINIRNIDGNTPFHFAAKTGSIDIVNFLLEKGGDTNAKNKKGNTPVNISVSHAKYKPVKCLLQRGADVYAKNRKGICIVHQLAISGGEFLFKYLLDNFEGTNVDVKNNKKQTPLALAMKLSSNKNVDILLGKQNINAQDIFGNTALHEACRFNNPAFVTKLLNAGANVNIQNNEGNTPIHLAVKHLAPVFIQSLLSYCTDLGLQNKLGWNILHSAASGNDIQVVQFLLNVIDQFSKTNNGDTILHVAASNTNTSVFRWLVANYNNMINECNNRGQNILLLCLKLAHQDVNFIEFLLNNGANINAVNSNGDNALHISVNYGRLDFINYFIQKGLDVNSVNNIGNSALHIACENGYLDIVKKLIDNSCNVNAVNSLGYTCLHVASKYGQMSVIKYLVNDVGCDVNIRSVVGENALQLAVEFEQDIVVKWYQDNNIFSK